MRPNPKRFSEHEPAGPHRDEFNTAGGWLPSLTSTYN
jgi:hypothetical protein